VCRSSRKTPTIPRGVSREVFRLQLEPEVNTILLDAPDVIERLQISDQTLLNRQKQVFINPIQRPRA
jgi:hypothetical protein